LIEVEAFERLLEGERISTLDICKLVATAYFVCDHNRANQLVGNPLHIHLRIKGHIKTTCLRHKLGSKLAKEIEKMGQSQSHGIPLPTDFLCCDSALEHQTRLKKRQAQLNVPAPRSRPNHLVTPRPDTVGIVNGIVNEAPSSGGVVSSAALDVGPFTQNHDHATKEAQTGIKPSLTPSFKNSGDLPSLPAKADGARSSRPRAADGTNNMPIARLCDFVDDQNRCRMRALCLLQRICIMN
jgi:hypothetical protein